MYEMWYCCSKRVRHVHYHLPAKLPEHQVWMNAAIYSTNNINRRPDNSHRKDDQR